MAYAHIAGIPLPIGRRGQVQFYCLRGHAVFQGIMFLVRPGAVYAYAATQGYRRMQHYEEIVGHVG